MASIRKYPSKKHGHMWRVQYRDKQGISRTKRGFRTKAAASEWAEKTTSQLRDGTWVAPEKGSVKVSDVYHMWKVNRLDVRESTRRSMESCWVAQIEPAWGNQAVGSITKAEIQKWVTRQAKTRAPATVHRDVRVLSTILSQAVDEGLINKNPCSGVRKPRIPKRDLTVISPAQIKAIAETWKDDTRLLVYFLAYTGVRWGEAAGLRIADIDLDNRRAIISRSASTIDGQVLIDEPKTGSSRSVALPDALIEPLRAQMGDRVPSAYLWPRADGGPRKALSAGGVWSRHVKWAQEDDPTIPHLRVHDLRHTAASILISEGASVLAVQRQLGHAQPSITLDVYGHWMPDELEMVGRILSRVVNLSSDSGNAPDNGSSGDDG